jgi:hypothetical protein
MPVKYQMKSAPAATEGEVSVVEFHLPAQTSSNPFAAPAPGYLIGEVNGLEANYNYDPSDPPSYRYIRYRITVLEEDEVIYVINSLHPSPSQFSKSFGFGGLRCSAGKAVTVRIECRDSVGFDAYLGLVVS